MDINSENIYTTTSSVIHVAEEGPSVYQKPKCNQCGHRWFPHVENPKKCPNPECQSRVWNQPKKKKRTYTRKAA